MELASVGEPVEEAQEEASKALLELGFEVSLLDPFGLDRGFFLPNGQVNGELLLTHLPGPSKGLRRVYLLNADATVRGLNFVFGLSSPILRRCFVALPRLKVGGNFRERVRKEVLHELGHTFGLSHCSNPYCVMRFSNSLMEVDEKSDRFCKLCLERLKRNLSQEL